MRFQKGNAIWKGRNHSEKTKQKMIESHKGKNLPEETKRKISEAHWKGGKRNYYHKLSRKIWEKHHGRKIPKGYLIHHEDENWKNIDPENLELMESRSAHMKHHRNIQELKKRSEKNEQN